MIIEHINTAEERRIFDESNITEISKGHVEHFPNTFDDWKRFMKDYPSKCLFWMTNRTFIMAYDQVTQLYNLIDHVPSLNEHEFPGMFLMLRLKDGFSVFLFATSEIEAFGILHEMVQYSDFSQCIRIEYPSENETTTLPTLLLKGILERVNTTDFFVLANFRFESEFSGRVLAMSGRNTSILFKQCDFLPLAQDAFVKSMISKEDETTGLTDLYMFKPYAFDDQTLFSLLKGNALKTLALYGYMYESPLHPTHGPNSEEFLQGLLEAIKCSRNLRCLKVPYCRDFPSYERYANFVNGLRSKSLRDLHICIGWPDRTIPLPLDSLRELSLTSFKFELVLLGQTRFNKLLEELGKCKTLTSVTLNYAGWLEDYDTQAAVDFKNFLKQHSNIDSVETVRFFDDRAYQMHVVPMLEYNRWQKKIRSLYGNERELRSALLAEALGGIFATKPSQSYQFIQANIDVIASCLDEKTPLLGAYTSRKVPSLFQPFNESDTKRMKL